MPSRRRRRVVPHPRRRRQRVALELRLADVVFDVARREGVVGLDQRREGRARAAVGADVGMDQPRSGQERVSRVPALRFPGYAEDR